MRSLWMFAFVVTIVRLVYVVWLCPYDLAEDEANYWVWSTHLDWSYYTKGPGIAWAIRLATTVFGTSEASIRLVAVTANVVTTTCVGLMAGWIAGDRVSLLMRGNAAKQGRGEDGEGARVEGAGVGGARMSDSEDPGATPPATRTFSPSAALFAAGAVQLSPIFQGTAIFSTIDGPYCACWALACVFAFRAFLMRSRTAWLALGAALGVGFLFKYTILLLIPGLLLFALLARKRLALANSWRSPCLAGALLMLLGFAPVIVWNQRNDWATVAHLLGHLGVKGGDMPVAAATQNPGSPSKGWTPKWTLEFIGSQIGMVGPLLILGVCASIARLRLARRAYPDSGASAPPSDDDKPLRSLALESPVGTLFLVCAAAPIILFYLGVSFIAEPEGNWAMGGYVTLLALAGCGAATGMHSFRDAVTRWRALPEPRPKLGVTRKKPETFVQVLWHTSLVYGILAGVVMLRLDWTIAVAKPLVAAVGPSLGLKPDKLFSGRAMNLFDADRMGNNAYGQAFYHLKQTTDKEPFYIAQHYGTAAVLSFYIPSQPLVLCSSHRMGGRPTPWDFWSDASLDNPALLGRPALLLGARIEQWEPMFERVTPIDTPNGSLEGEHKKGRPAFLGFAFKGWPSAAEKPTP